MRRTLALICAMMLVAIPAFAKELFWVDAEYTGWWYHRERNCEIFSADEVKQIDADVDGHLYSPCSRCITGDYYAGDEVFYHKYQSCGAYTGRRHATGSEGRYPCPICADKEVTDLKGLSAVEQGNTIVIRITDEYLYENDWKFNTIYASTSMEIAEGEEARSIVCSQLNGERLLEFIKMSDDTDWSMTLSRTADVLPYYQLDGESRSDYSAVRLQQLNARHINGCWYFCMQAPDEFLANGAPLQWRVWLTGLAMFENYKLAYGTTRELTQTVRLDLSGTKSEKIYETELSIGSMTVYEEMSTNICVIRRNIQPSADTRFPNTNYQLIIGHNSPPIEVDAYTDATDLVFVCVLSDGELQAIRDGVSVQLDHP